MEEGYKDEKTERAEKQVGQNGRETLMCNVEYNRTNQMDRGASEVWLYPRDMNVISSIIKIHSF